MRVLEALGRGVGGMVAPLAFEASLIRRARVFHPDGDVHLAEVRPSGFECAAGDLAERLAGPALVRLSGATWRRDGGDRPDILGIAMRFRQNASIRPELEAGDQDLLFATFRAVWQLPFGALVTNAHDFLANRYHTVLPSEVKGLGRMKWRLTPRPVITCGKNRHEKLANAIAQGAAAFRLEMRQIDRGTPWRQLCSVEIGERVEIDQEALHFNPFHAGKGIEPAGFFQMVRAGAYAGSQVGRAVANGRLFAERVR